MVYVTGSEESQIAVAALKAGAADYVVKTVGDDFFDLLERAFGQALASVRLRPRTRTPPKTRCAPPTSGSRRC